MIKTDKFENFEGLNRGVSPFLIKTSELIRCLNFYSPTVGVKAKRPGYATFLDAPDTDSVRNLIYFEIGSGATKRLLRVSGTKIYVNNLIDATWGSSVKTLTNADRRLGVAALSGKLFLTNGVDTSFTYDGTNFADAATAPKGRYAATFNRRVQVWGVDANPDRLYESKIDDPTDWTINANDPSAARYWNIDPDSAGNLTGGAVTARRMTYFKQKLAYRFDGAEFFPLSTDAGLVSQAGIVQGEEMVIYPSRNGVYGFIDDKPVQISTFLADYFDGIAASEFNPNTASLAAGLWGKHYLLSVGNITDRDGNVYAKAVFAYDQRLNQWFLWSFAHRPYSWLTYPDANSDEQTIFGDTAGNTFKFNSGTDDAGTAIESEMVTAPLLGEPQQSYNLRHIAIGATPNANAQVFYDFFDDEWRLLGELSGLISRFALPAGAAGRSPRIKIADVGKSTGYTILSIALASEKTGDWWQ